MDSNLVSVIIPTYNRADLVGRAIRSVLKQTYKQFELIVVNDGSTDDTEKEILGFSDERIIYVKHDTNKGVSAARNTGIKITHGKYLAFLDSDDEWMKTKLEKQMAAIINTDDLVGLVYSPAFYIKNKTIFFVPSMENHLVDNGFKTVLQLKSSILLPSCIVKRDCFEKVGLFDENLRVGEDGDMLIRIARYFSFLNCGEPLIIIYKTLGSLWSDKKGQIEAYKQLLQKHFTTIRKDPEMLAEYYSNIGYRLCAEGQMGEGRRYIIRCLKSKPLQLNAWYMLLKSLFVRWSPKFRQVAKIEFCP